MVVIRCTDMQNARYTQFTVGMWKAKCKAIPLQARTGREGSRRLGLPDFKTIGT